MQRTGGNPKHSHPSESVTVLKDRSEAKIIGPMIFNLPVDFKDLFFFLLGG